MESLVLKIAGLFTNFNELSNAPLGALSQAQNIVINKDGLAESRRGFDRLAFTLPLATDRGIKLFQYQDTLLCHYRQNQLAYYGPNGIIPYQGSYSDPDPNLALIKSAEANQNLYFTSTKGIQRLDKVTSTPQQAGQFKGLDILATPSPAALGFMQSQAQVAYRMIWGTTDVNGNLILGFPSQRAIVANTTSVNQDVSVTMTTPSGVTTNNFYQIYRSNQALALYAPATGGLQDISYAANSNYSGTAGNLITVDYVNNGSITPHGGETVAVNPSTLTVGGVSNILYTSVLGGGLGQQITIAYTAGGTAGAEVVTVSGYAISVQIQSGVSTDTDIYNAIIASSDATALVSAAVTGGGGTETAYGPTALTGGNITVTILSGTSTATDILAALNAYQPALNIVAPTITGTASAAQTAPASTTLSGGSVTLTTPDDNMQLVYEGTLTGSTLSVGALTYTSVPVGSLGNFVKVSYIGGGTAGSEIVTTLPSTLVVQDITYTSVALGGLGDLVNVTYTGGAVAGNEVVTVFGDSMTVQIQSGVSTATQVLNAVMASSAALNILAPVITGTPTAAQTTASQTYLTGGTVQVKIQSGVSTDTQIAAAVQGSTDAAIYLTVTGSGAGTEAPFGPTALSGGVPTFTVIDQVPDSLRGAALYTNAAEEGILQANELPPYAKDIATFVNCLFFGNTKTKQVLPISILAVGATSGVQVGDVITIAGTAYTGGNSEDISTKTFQVVTSGSAAQNINDTALSLIRVINQNTDNTAVYAYYLSSSTSLPGQLQIEERILGGAPYTITANMHGTAYSPALPATGAKVISTNQTNLNGLYYSKQGEPDAVPSVNYIPVGSASQPIYRIIALRDSLFILKQDGVFRLTGSDPNSFSITPLDNTAILLAPESAATLSNQIFALTTQGVVAISDGGVEVVSRPIENQIVALFGSALVPLEYHSHGIGYESEREYILWTVSQATDTYATQAFVYNIFTKAWTTWDRAQGPGLILQADNKLYVTDPTTNYINQERKDETYTDYSDESLPVTLSSFSGMVVQLVDASDAAIGDMLFQSADVSSLITAVDLLNNTVTVTDTLTWSLIDPTFILKAISCLLEWIAQPAQGQPGMLKQFSEASLQFKESSFAYADANFYSEIDTGIEDIQFSGTYTGAWGKFPWGSGPWGGTPQRAIVRVYVPQAKQRCGLLSTQFTCDSTWSTFQLEGIVLSYRYVSTRTSR